MRDDVNIPNMGTTSDNSLNATLRNIERTLRQIISVGRMRSTYVNLYPMTVASLPARASAGDLSFASDGRKNGEGVGAGTGVMVFFDGTNWIACDSGQTVSA